MCIPHFNTVLLFFMYLQGQGVKNFNYFQTKLYNSSQLSISICHHWIQIFLSSLFILSNLFVFFYVCITYQYNLQVYNFHYVNDAEKRRLKIVPSFLLTVLIYFRMSFPVVLFLQIILIRIICSFATLFLIGSVLFIILENKCSLNRPLRVDIFIV